VAPFQIVACVCVSFSPGAAVAQGRRSFRKIRSASVSIPVSSNLPDPPTVRTMQSVRSEWVPSVRPSPHSARHTLSLSLSNQQPPSCHALPSFLPSFLPSPSLSPPLLSLTRARLVVCGQASSLASCALSCPVPLVSGIDRRSRRSSPALHNGNGQPPVASFSPLSSLSPLSSPRRRRPHLLG
jgi:hypothetical protein